MESQLDGLATVQVGLEVPSSTMCNGLVSHGYDAGLLSACIGHCQDPETGRWSKMTLLASSHLIRLL